MGEGDTSTYTVKLSIQPTMAVTVTVSGTGRSVTVDTDSVTPEEQTTLSFTTSNWETEQTVTVAAVEDDNARPETVTLTHTTTSDGDAYSVSQELVVEVVDNHTAGLVLSPTTVTVEEKASATYTVRLATKPTGGPVTVTVTGMGSDVSVDTDSGTQGAQTTLSFTPSNWITDQTVTVIPAPDDDTNPETVTLSHTAAGADYDSVTESLVVTVTDNDTVGLVLSTTEVMVAEAGSAAYTVKLATEPTAVVTVTVSGMDNGVSVDTDSMTPAEQASLSFTPRNWDAEQTVTVLAADDDNATSETVTLTHSATGGDYESVSQELVVTVTEAETTSLVVSPGVVNVVEASSATYTVKLASQPTDGVTVTVSGVGSGVSVDTDSGVSGDQTMVSFTTTNWNVLQTVTVQAAADDDNTTSETVTLTHSATGGDYESLSQELVVKVVDDDTPGLVVLPATVTVAEAGSTTYTVRLVKKPTMTVTVTVSGMGSDVTVDTDNTDPGDQNTLSFTTDHWNTDQTVTVSGVDDDNATSEMVTLTHTASGGGYGSVSQKLVVTVTNDDTRGLVFSPTAVTVAEGGSATYTVRLATEATAWPVKVTVSGMGNGVSVDTNDNRSGDQNVLTVLGPFRSAPSTWDIPQPVIVSAADDDNTSPETVTLTHTASGGDYSSVQELVVVTVMDNDNICQRLNGLSFDGRSCGLYNQGISSLSSDDFAGLSNLQRLDLARNKLSSLPADVFDSLSNLEELYLHENKLSSLSEDAFAGLSNLEELHLYYNSLSSLSDNMFVDLSKLQTLNLYDNSLSSLSEDVF
ncbi:MAG: hypothetical protein TH68_04230, partial [Candidatus Synechococcus spongiarum 142]